jgi:D-glycero-D-manno-heptose 1,7-bisphosphate phosphatase
MRQAVVLVGGKGTRLGEITANMPKPLLPIRGDKRFLDYLLERVVAYGFTDVVLVAGHLGHLVQERYDGVRLSEASLTVVVEPEPAGTGGALRYVADKLDNTFMLMNGDSFFGFDFQRLGDVFNEDALGAIALRVVNDSGRYGTVEHAGERVFRFTEKNTTNSGPAAISGGVYFLDRAILDRIDHVPLSIETELFPRLAAEGRLRCKRFEGYFIDIGLPDTFEQARRELPTLLDALI